MLNVRHLDTRTITACRKEGCGHAEVGLLDVMEVVVIYLEAVEVVLEEVFSALVDLVCFSLRITVAIMALLSTSLEGSIALLVHLQTLQLN